MKWRSMDLVKARWLPAPAFARGIGGALSADTTGVTPIGVNHLLQQATSRREAIGHSKNFSFDEAFKDAMQPADDAQVR